MLHVQFSFLPVQVVGAEQEFLQVRRRMFDALVAVAHETSQQHSEKYVASVEMLMITRETQY